MKENINARIDSLGAIPIGHLMWEDFQTNKDSIINVCLEQEKPNIVESNVATRIKNNLWESQFNFLDSSEKLVNLKLWFLKATTDFVNHINGTEYKIAITESWAHITRPGGFHGPHRHTQSTWSGIFYVYADDDSRAENWFFNHFHLPMIPGYEFFAEQYKTDFVPGKLIIFPSTMLHYATPYLGLDKRIVIAFNSVVI
jgi:uncharacterized protein (TIGR02466 family)